MLDFTGDALLAARPAVLLPGVPTDLLPARGQSAAVVLVVEDDPDLADVLAYLLHRQGHGVILAADGVEALCRFQQDAPDLVLLDLQLPRLSGLEVCRAIRAVARTPILCVSAFADEGTRTRALALGADGFLLKPFSIALITERMSALLRSPSA